MASLIKDKLTSRSPRSSLDGGSRDEEADKYRLLVTAGPSYDTSTHKIVRVNTSTPTTISNEHLTAKIKVRIRGYRGLPSSSPGSSPYFEDADHVKDQYSISFSFVPKVDLPSVDTVWGNDFDHPVRDRLPPGFNTAFKIVKDFIDPGLECDAYADKPWLYGPSLSCWFGFRVGEKMADGEREAWEKESGDKDEGEDIVREGATGKEPQKVRDDLHIPADSEKRRKHFLQASSREHFTFEAGRHYEADFHNPYLDFGNFALKLPGFSIKVIKYIDDKSHRLRYVFKNRRTGDVYFCVCLNLLWGEELKNALQDERGEIERFAGGEVDGGKGGDEAGDSEAEEAAGRNGHGSGARDQRDDAATEPEPPAAAQKQQPENESKETKETAKSPVEPGMTDKPDYLVEEIRKTSIQDTLQGTASKDQRTGGSNILDDGLN